MWCCEDEAKASAQDKMQRGVVTSLSHKNAHLLKMWQPWAIGSLDSSNRCLFEHARCPHDLFQDAI
uniref:Uncharacterized protein n=1 Tax=Triticum urartu TaxID=4572 RepID=A0A8R7QV06_TRIUA